LWRAGQRCGFIASTGHKAHTPAGFWYGTNSHPSPLSSIILWGSQWPASWTANDVRHTETQHPAEQRRYLRTHPSCRGGPSRARSARRSGSGLIAAGLALLLPAWAAALLGPGSVNVHASESNVKQARRTKLNPPPIPYPRFTAVPCALFPLSAAC
jgi:hypothetical protein